MEVKVSERELDSEKRVNFSERWWVGLRLGLRSGLRLGLGVVFVNRLGRGAL